MALICDKNKKSCLGLVSGDISLSLCEIYDHTPHKLGNRICNSVNN